MIQGYLFKRQDGRYAIDKSTYYFTCGDVIQVHEYTKLWVKGVVEHDGLDYYYMNGNLKMYLEEGMMVRVKE